ncbi:uncharacterized protein LOC106670522 [Cimex lectularius]|uniref:Uncharacterized protein n=1 Tax=Cimex lectularius TaxID=79782 RepID=A0A8I6S3G4_CIMLE|nr:uncharacterized protein LOC106670522 [Cimex lectularius]
MNNIFERLWRRSDEDNSDEFRSNSVSNSNLYSKLDGKLKKGTFSEDSYRFGRKYGYAPAGPSSSGIGHISENIEMLHKLENLEREVEYQKEHIAKIYTEWEHLKSQLIAQTLFCASVGGCIGTMFWKGAVDREGVKYTLSSSKISEFFKFTNGILNSFISVYKENMPNLESEESQFVLSVCGCIANISAVTQGARKIITDINGKELVETLINILPAIPKPAGDSLKRVLLAILYNIGMIGTGLKMIQTRQTLLQALAEILQTRRQNELVLIALRLVELFTSGIPTTDYLFLLIKIVGKDVIEPYKTSDSLEIRMCAESILINFSEAEFQLGIPFQFTWRSVPLIQDSSKDPNMT